MNYPAPRTTSTYAVVSLITGILGWTMIPVLGSIGAIIFGHMARAEIRRSRGQMDGNGLAVTGLVLGWIALVVELLGVVTFFLFLGGLAWLAQQQAH